MRTVHRLLPIMHRHCCVVLSPLCVNSSKSLLAWDGSVVDIMTAWNFFLKTRLDSSIRTVMCAQNWFYDEFAHEDLRLRALTNCADLQCNCV